MELSQFNQSQTMSSREIAQITGKRHDHVLRDVDFLNESYHKIGFPKIGEGYYTHPNTGNQQHREMLLSKMQTMDLMTGYSVELRIKVNRRWEELENSKNTFDLSNPYQMQAMLTNWIADKEKAERLEIENKELKPKSIIAEALEVSQSSVLIGDVANQLKKNGFKIGRDRLFDVLRDKELIQKNSTRPTQKALELELFEVQERMIQVSGTMEPKFTTKVKGKGQSYILNKFLTGKWVCNGSNN